MSRPARLVVAWTAGAAVVAFVVMVALGVLPRAGTGQFLDPWRGLADTLARRAPGWSRVSQRSSAP